jgi:precorrin-6B methylase 2
MVPAQGFDSQDSALLALLEAARSSGYDFVTVTPETHRRVIERDNDAEARDLRDVFGWSRRFAESLLPDLFLQPLRQSGFLQREGDGWRSGLRISTLDESLFLHSAYPTDDSHSVFLGPDTYRFARLIKAVLPNLPPVRHLVDIGAGAGVGGIVAGRISKAAVTLTDINPDALRLARINAAAAGVKVSTVLGSGLEGVSGAVDLIIANPPFVIDEAGRRYRDGGDMHGAALSLDWALSAAQRIESGGTVILYTGSAIVAGEDRLKTQLEQKLPELGCSLDYEEIDPDIFGELVSEVPYRDVERVAAVGGVIRKA